MKTTKADEKALLEAESRYCSYGDTVHYLEPAKLFAGCNGSFLYDYEDKPYLDQRLARLGEEWNIPVAACNDYGHGQYAAILPIGELAELDASQKTLIYPNL